MKKKLAVVIVSALILIIGFIFVLGIYLSNTRLDVYSFSNDGRSITKAGNNYVFNAISNDKLRGKAIGKAEFNGEKYYIYQEKGKEMYDYIIVMGVDIGVDEEFIISHK